MTQEEAASIKERQEEEDRKDQLRSDDLIISAPKEDDNDYLATGALNQHDADEEMNEDLVGGTVSDGAHETPEKEDSEEPSHQAHEAILPPSSLNMQERESPLMLSPGGGTTPHEEPEASPIMSPPHHEQQDIEMSEENSEEPEVEEPKQGDLEVSSILFIRYYFIISRVGCLN